MRPTLLGFGLAFFSMITARAQGGTELPPGSIALVATAKDGAPNVADAAKSALSEALGAAVRAIKPAVLKKKLGGGSLKSEDPTELGKAGGSLAVMWVVRVVAGLDADGNSGGTAGPKGKIFSLRVLVVETATSGVLLDREFPIVDRKLGAPTLAELTAAVQVALKPAPAPVPVVAAVAPAPAAPVAVTPPPAPPAAPEPPAPAAAPVAASPAAAAVVEPAPTAAAPATETVSPAPPPSSDPVVTEVAAAPAPPAAFVADSPPPADHEGEVLLGFTLREIIGGGLGIVGVGLIAGGAAHLATRDAGAVAYLPASNSIAFTPAESRVPGTAMIAAGVGSIAIGATALWFDDLLGLFEGGGEP